MSSHNSKWEDAYANWFFSEPDLPEEDVVSIETDGNKFPVLYKIRREIQDVLFGEIVPETAIHSYEPRRLFAAISTIFTAIDLLSIFYSGSDINGKVQQRFTAFLQEVAGFNNKNSHKAALYWTIRNGIIHSFGLYSAKTQKRIRLVSTYDPSVAGPTVAPMWETSDSYVVSVIGTYDLLINAINKYHERLLRSPDLQRKFDAVFFKYGITVQRTIEMDENSQTSV